MRKELKKCSQRCKGKILKSGRYCECLERQLPKMGSYVSVDARPADVSNHAVGIFAPKTPEMRPEQLEELLVYHGLSPYEVEVIMARFYDEMTYDAIVEEYGWTSKGNLFHHLKNALKKLKKTRFKLK